MGKYGSGLTMGQICNREKEQIKAALNGYRIGGEDENGFVYYEAPKEECDAFILSAFDEAVYQLMQAMASARALERVLKDKGIEITPREYMEAMALESTRFNDYKYEDTDADGI